MELKTCMRCKRDAVSAIKLDDSMDACGHTFTAQLPAERCAACQEVVIQGSDIRKFELRIAVELAKAGERTAEAFKLLRRALGLSPEQLASLLDLTPDCIGYWEKGEWPVDPRALSVLASLVISHLDDRDTSLDSLRILREPKQLGRRIRLHLEGAVAAARKALEFGSAAHTTPALA